MSHQNKLYTYIIWENRPIAQWAIIYGAPYNKGLVRGKEHGIYPTFNMLAKRIR